MSRLHNDRRSAVIFKGQGGSALERSLMCQIRAARLPAPERELRFARPERQFRFDFSWADRNLAAEIDGGTWTAGRHVRGKGAESDAEKSCEAAIRGWRVMRFTGDMVRDGRALRLLERAFA